jgi:epoxyqueuosine reductase
MTPVELREYIMGLAASAGFDRCGVARAEPIGRGDYVRRWLAEGRAGSIDYLHRNVGARLDPGEILPGARSVFVVALSYNQPPPDPPEDGRSRGRVAMYAWGDDYHEVIREKLRTMRDRMRAELATPFETRICVDTAPVIERELAAAAGIGWIGKNTMVLSREMGSYFFLGVMLTTLEIAADEPVVDHCGSCTACLEACPTQAFPAAYQMDASRCISYLTIEHRGDISKPFQEMMGDWVFGCDVCQEVCPYNRKAPATRESRFAAREPGPRPALDDLLAWDDEEYRKKLSGNAMQRAKFEMLRRNARIAIENVARGRVSPPPQEVGHPPPVACP